MQFVLFVLFVQSNVQKKPISRHAKHETVRKKLKHCGFKTFKQSLKHRCDHPCIVVTLASGERSVAVCVWLSVFGLWVECGWSLVSLVLRTTWARPLKLHVYHDELQRQFPPSPFPNQVELTTRLSHENVIQTYAIFKKAGKLVFVMDYASGGDLSKVITMHYGLLSERLAVHAVLDPFLRGLEFMHSKVGMLNIFTLL